jgi:hypothetical protein
LIAAALAIALPDALFRGDNISSAAVDGPMMTPLIVKSPSRILGMLPETPTLIETPRLSTLIEAPSESCNV